MDKLPHEILVTILAYTGPPDILAMACVSKFFHRISLDPILHRSASFEGEWHVTLKFVTRYITRFKKSLVSLDLQNCYWLKPASLVTAICRCQDLVHLRLIGCNISSDSLSEILSANKNLKSLSWSLSSKICEKMSGYFMLTKTISARDELKIFKKFSSSALNSVELQLQLPENKFSRSLCIPDFVLVIAQHIISSMHISEVKISFSRPFGGARTMEHTHVKLKERSIDWKQAVGGREINMSLNNFVTFFIYSAITSASSQGDLEILVVPAGFIPKKFKIPLTSVTKGYLTKASLSCWSNENTAEILTTLTSGSHLTHLNLENIDAVTSGFLTQLAIGCPSLTSLNLCGCSNSMDSLEGIQALATHCSALKHLNLSQIHYHGKDPRSKTNQLLSALSGMHQITSLALPACGIFKGAGNGSGRSETGRSQSASGSATEPVESSFAAFTASFVGMKKFELIAICIESSLTKPSVLNKIRQRLCPLPDPDILRHLVNWKYLEDLTLAGLPLRVLLDSLVSVTRTCTELKYLSLRNLGSLQHSSAVAALCNALSYCSKLQFFRVEHSYLNITPALVSSLHNAKNLERVCILSKHGNLDSTLFFDWFEKCPKLTVFQIFVGNLTSNAGKMITSNLQSRYSAKRPALCVLVHPFNSSLETAFRHIPAVHHDQLTLFSSNVAKFY